MSEAVEETTQEAAPGTPVEPVAPEDEPVQPDTHPEQPEPQETTEQPAGAISEEEAMRATKDSEADWKRFETRTRDRWGAEAEHFMSGPLCLDQHKGLIDVRHAGLYPEEAVNVISQYLNIVRPVTLRQMPDTRTCDVCDGEGEGLTGSNNPKYRKKVCPACKGFGYLPPPHGAESHNGTPPPELIPVSDTNPPLPVGDLDDFGHPRLLPDGRDNPNFGKMPKYFDPQFP